MTANDLSQPTHGQAARRMAGDEVACQRGGLAGFLVRALARDCRELAGPRERYGGWFDGDGAQRTDFDPPADVIGLDKKGVSRETMASARFCKVG